MAKPISKFFADLGFPLKNVRWSWGAKSGSTIILRTWDDEFAVAERTVQVLREPMVRDLSESYGLDERIVHLEELWGGGIAGYTVIAIVKDRTASPREIKDFRDDILYPVTSLVPQQNGAIRAVVDRPILVRELASHSAGHRTAAGSGPFPASGDRSGISTNSYREKLPAFREWLIEVAKAKSVVLYGEVMDRFGLDYYSLRNAMSRLGKDSVAAGEPVITALIVDKVSRRCSEGFFAEFGVEDDEAERQRLYAFWSGEQPRRLGSRSQEAEDPDFVAREIRFTKAAARPEQAAFRQAVFRRFRGRCVVTGCTVPEALEAAHREGRDWRQGHNDAADGLLLRRDIHALYDCGLVKISEELTVQVDASVSAEYGEYAKSQPS